MLTGPRDPVAEFGARSAAVPLDRGASLHLVDEGADLPGLGPGLDLAFEQVTPLQLLAASLLGFDPLALCLLPLALVSLGLKTLGTPARLASATRTKPSTTSFSTSSRGHFLESVHRLRRCARVHSAASASDSRTSSHEGTASSRVYGRMRTSGQPPIPLIPA